MFELPELTVIAGQMREALVGKVVARGALGNSPHKFVWYNRTHEEFAALTAGRTLGPATVRGRWLLLPLEPAYVLVLGEWGGRLRYEPPPAPRPTRYHLSLDFADGSVLSATTQMWGAAELYVQGEEGSRQYIKDMRSTPLDPEFTPDYFEALVAEAAALKKSAKGLLTQGQLVPGLGNSSAQDILFRAGLDPRRAVATLAPVQRRAMYGAIVDTVREIIAAGGRYDETDLYGAPGGYVRLMDKNAVARPCPACGGPILQISYLGGACYLCPNCQG